MSKRVLCLLATGFEEIETVTPVDLLRRAEVQVVIAALGSELSVTGRNGMTLMADALLTEVEAESFDLLFIPGGPAVKDLRTDGRPARLARDFAAAGKPVAAICAGPLVLLDAELLMGKRHTAHDSTYGELPQADASAPVVADAGIITSRGAGTALQFGLELVTQLTTPDTAAQVARSIMM